jgi:hypothetical protein
VSISFDETFGGGTLSVTATNACGTSVAKNLVIVAGNILLCEMATCFSENANFIIDDSLISMLDLFQNYNRIESATRIYSLRNVTFKAGNVIILNPPFEVELGATFLAEIETCLLVITRD